LSITKKTIVAIIAGAAVIAIVTAYKLRQDEPTTYATSKVDKGQIRQVVEATGTINAVITVQVGSQVSGEISRLYVDFNSQVKKDQIIAQIAPALFEGTLSQTKADLESAKANVAAAVANTLKAKAAEVQTKADYERNLGLAKQGVVSQQVLDLAKANAESSAALVSAGVAQEQQARAQVQQKQAAVRVAQTNLDYTTIRAPIDGTVVARNVDVGQTVAASLQAPTLFTIAQDLTKMQVYAKTDESDVGGMRPEGQLQGGRISERIIRRHRFTGQDEFDCGPKCCDI
jgi:HlyD family secretion protein